MRQQTYNCASGIQVSILELAKFIIAEMGGQNTITFQDWRPGDVKYFDVDNRRLVAMGMQFRTDWQEVVRGVINSK
jgi:UDP-glucose 4-epimerase